MIKVFCWRCEPGLMIRWGEGDLTVPTHLLGKPFSEWPKKDKTVRHLLQDAEEDENGVYLTGSAICPSDDPILQEEKFYVEPLGLFDDPGLTQIYRLYQTTDGNLDHEKYTQAAILGVLLFKNTMENCRYVWAEKHHRLKSGG